MPHQEETVLALQITRTLTAQALEVPPPSQAYQHVVRMAVTKLILLG